MLDEFRSTSITWDKATRRIYSPITANESDSNGRKLNIQVVNSGQVENLTGATLHLYWETKDKTQHGLDAFTASDISKGEFEIFYTTGMLSNVGELNATLVLVDATGRVVSDWFKITVTRGIDDDAIQSENSFSSLTQALIDVSNLEQNYTPRLNDLTAQLAQTDSELSVKIDRGDVSVSDIDKNKGLLDETFFSDEFNERLNGGELNVTNVPDDSITNKKMTKKAVRKENTNFVNVSTNLFDKNDVISGHSIDPTTGELTPNSQYAVSNKKIPVIAGEPVVFAKSNERSSRYAFYNGKTFISSDTVARTETHKVVTPPTGANGALYAVQNADLGVAQIIQGATLLPYQPYIAPRLTDISPAIEKNSVKIVYQNGIIHQVHEGDKTTTLHYENGLLAGYTEATVIESVRTNLVYEDNNLTTVEREVL